MISINDVYQTTLTLLNKEQRGYVTPKEFNEIAGVVQNEVFEKYFIDASIPENMDSELSDIGTQRREKIQPFLRQIAFTADAEGLNEIVIPSESGVYRLLEFYPEYEGVDIPIKADRVSVMEANQINLSRLTSPTKYNPIVTVVGSREGVEYQLYFYPAPLRAQVLFVGTPAQPNWVGSTVDGELVPNIFDDSFVNFQLHASEYAEVVAKVLGYFGLSTRSDEVIQVAGTKEQINSQI